MTTSAPTTEKATTLPRWKAPGVFIGQFIEEPRVIGAVAPSSSRMARLMLEGLDLANASAVLEYGPGTGAFTVEILRRLGPRTRFVAIEVNPRMAAMMRHRFPHVRLLEESVENARSICDGEGIASADVIVSGLPWTMFDEALQRRILDGVKAVLRPGGVFVTFAYTFTAMMPAGRRFVRLMREYFPRVERSRIEWRNIPPAAVLRGTM